MPLATTPAGYVDDHGDNQNDQVQACYRLTGVHHLSVNQRRERQENESENRKEQAVIGPL